MKGIPESSQQPTFFKHLAQVMGIMIIYLGMKNLV